MWHYGRAQDADADVEHSLIRDNVRSGNKSKHHAHQTGLREDQLGREASTDSHDERNHQCLDITETFVLEIKHGENVERSNDATPHQR